MKCAVDPCRGDSAVDDLCWDHWIAVRCPFGLKNAGLILKEICRPEIRAAAIADEWDLALELASA